MHAAGYRLTVRRPDVGTYDGRVRKERKKRKRGFGFFVKAVMLVAGTVVAIAVAGDDELRASLKNKLKLGG